MEMGKNRIVLSIVSVLILIGAGVLLWLNPISSPSVQQQQQKITEYTNVFPDGFPADFPGDPNIAGILKSQKTVSVDGATEFILEYVTSKPQANIIQDVTTYASLKNLASIYDGSGVNADGNNYVYFSATDDAKANEVSVNVSDIPGTGGALSDATVTIFSK